MSNTTNELNNLRHSAAHLLAAAVMELWPNTKRTIGPSIENGFYFDFDFGGIKISEDDFPKIEAKMHEILAGWEGFEGRDVSVEEAKKLYKNNEYKIELIEEFSGEGQNLTVYKSGEFEDLCRGGHIDNPKEALRHFKILSIAGAYWRGNEKNKMLTRIYGTVFPTKEELDQYLHRVEEAKKRDHKKLARELDLIVFSDLVGSGLPLYTPKGAVLRSQVYNYSRDLNAKIGYGETSLPGMNRAELFKISGHYEKYKDDMFNVHSHYSQEEFFLKPMNCPQHCVIYASQSRSYRDLPIRLADFSILYRDERPGEINGLLRSRAFTQDDGHCFCREDQIGEEFECVLNVVGEALKTYGFDYWIRLSLRDPQHPEKYLGDDSIWNRAESKLKELVVSKNLPFKEAPGEAAIYGPKLDFMATDSLGREWQISTIQLDMNMPGRFGLKYADSDGKEKTPVMIHRAIVGSERFIAILIEHYGGAFPLWLSPVQAIVLPISDKHIEYAGKVINSLRDEGIRVELNDKNEPLNARVRDAEMQKVPYILVVGDKEIEAESVAIRKRGIKGTTVAKLADFALALKADIIHKV